ncbi:TauD/TfdA family dioxygenase [Pseudoalteromonas denitrificans]|nr:TauD/TfdA family dioxygenase [Pseudoalteromonas denitrificans]
MNTQFSSVNSTDSFPFMVTVTETMSLNKLKEYTKKLINEQLLQYGAILVRGCTELTITDFKELSEHCTGESKNYDFASTPRSKVAKGIYTTTEYPPHMTIPLHNEQSYTNQWADHLWLFCDVAATKGGETPLADSRLVYQKIPEDIRNRFIEKGIMYVRNYGGGLDLPWQEVFNTDDKSVVEQYCTDQNIEFEWKEDDELRTKQICQAITSHPVSGEKSWFNQAHLFHVSALAEKVRTNLLSIIEESELPRNAYYGDGSPIKSSDLDIIRAVYDEVEVSSPWQKGDFVIVDNILAAHGRKSFEGERKVYVVMT